MNTITHMFRLAVSVCLLTLFACQETENKKDQDVTQQKFAGLPDTTKILNTFAAFVPGASLYAGGKYITLKELKDMRQTYLKNSLWIYDDRGNKKDLEGFAFSAQELSNLINQLKDSQGAINPDARIMIYLGAVTKNVEGKDRNELHLICVPKKADNNLILPSTDDEVNNLLFDHADPCPPGRPKNDHLAK